MEGINMEPDISARVASIANAFKCIYLLEWESTELEIEYDRLFLEIDQEYASHLGYAKTSSREWYDMCNREAELRTQMLDALYKSSRLRSTAESDRSSVLKERSKELFYILEDHKRVREVMHEAQINGYELASIEKDSMAIASESL